MTQSITQVYSVDENGVPTLVDTIVTELNIDSMISEKENQLLSMYAELQQLQAIKNQ